MTLPSLDALKAQAQRLRRSLEAAGTPVSHSRALELIARQLGYRDWNTLHAAVGNQPDLRLEPGSRVRGTYLGQSFEGEILGVERRSVSGTLAVTIQFDQPVDVVTFDSFSAYRSRVRATVDQSGQTLERTSNGEPHMTLRRV
ncbi:glyoxalase superfamily protein [Roseibium aestuarii]|uniref:Glyoxalase superfamily protein n=1 Tax=Roseibium aestuarii TaxID=2600299 RepID=A0ABW4JVR3_9HYPH|nr:glyoxalase superfamily protein [Roseibium aestuarii]